MKRSARTSLHGRVILLGVTGSIAAYKACEIVRRLKDEGADVFCLMTSGAKKFISPLTLGALSGNAVACGIWDEKLWKMAHLDLAEKADLLIVAPLSANSLSKLAAGLADDVVSATALAAKSPVLLAPAMHENMWLHPATQANVKRLRSYGYIFAGPEHGALTHGAGWGRMAAPNTILAAACKILSRGKK